MIKEKFVNRYLFPGKVYLYFFCQSINLTAAVIAVSLTAIVGNSLAPNPYYATIPYGVQFLLILLATYPIAILMQNKGRKTGFMIGAFSLGLSGIVGYSALSLRSFTLLIISHGLLGLFTACANYYRFAVTDDLPVARQSNALSLVVAGGILAGFVGPFISSQLRVIDGYPLFSLCYAFLTVLALLNFIIILFVPDTKVKKNKQQAKNYKNPTIGKSQLPFNNISIALCSMVFCAGLMNLTMVQASLYLNHIHISFDDTAIAIQWHVIAMFFPSFFSGSLIGKFGHFRVIMTGFLFFALSYVVNIIFSDYIGVSVGLILLGLGWNFCYVGGSALLAVSVSGDDNAPRWQGIGDTALATSAMIAAFLPSVLLQSIYWTGSNILCLTLGLSAISFCLLKQRLMPIKSPASFVKRDKAKSSNG